jgi:hypothetical protein
MPEPILIICLTNPIAFDRKWVKRIKTLFCSSGNKSHSHGGDAMTSKRIQLLLTRAAAWISLVFMVTTTYAGSVVIGGDHTDVGTIVIVSPKPGDTAQANGTALLNTLAHITVVDNNRYLIKLGPGIYDIGANSLHMKEYVDIEGSGEKTTVVTGHIDSDLSGVVRGANHAEIRFLTVQNTGGGTYAIAIYNLSISPKITNVTASASGGTLNNWAVFNYQCSATMTNVRASASGGTNNWGVLNSSDPSNAHSTMTNVTASASGGTGNFGVYNQFSSPTMMNVTASAAGVDSANDTMGVYNYQSSPTMTNVIVSASGGTIPYGVYNQNSSPTMTNVTVSAAGTHGHGVFSFNGGTIIIKNSFITGSPTIYNDGTGTKTLVANTKLDGGPVNNTGSGTLTCVGAYDANYVALGTNCQ